MLDLACHLYNDYDSLNRNDNCKLIRSTDPKAFQLQWSKFLAISEANFFAT